MRGCPLRPQFRLHLYDTVMPWAALTFFVWPLSDGGRRACFEGALFSFVVNHATHTRKHEYSGHSHIPVYSRLFLRVEYYIQGQLKSSTSYAPSLEPQGSKNPATVKQIYKLLTSVT